SQPLSIGSGCAASLDFWLHVDTEETTTSTAYDTLKVDVVSGSTATTVASFSNLDAASGYTRHSVDLSRYAGQSVTLRFTGTEGTKLATSFVVDDTAVTVS